MVESPIFEPKPRNRGHDRRRVPHLSFSRLSLLAIVFCGIIAIGRIVTSQFNVMVLAGASGAAALVVLVNRRNGLHMLVSSVGAIVGACLGPVLNLQGRYYKHYYDPLSERILPSAILGAILGWLLACILVRVLPAMWERRGSKRGRS